MNASSLGYFSNLNALTSCTNKSNSKSKPLATLNNENLLRYGDIKFNVLPICKDENNYTIASLKFPCDVFDLYQESPLANLKLNLNRHSAMEPRDSLASLFEFKNVFCRNQNYPFTEIDRFPVPNDKISFSTKFLSYKNIPYYDISNRSGSTFSGDFDRTNFVDTSTASDNKLKNPMGRTGIRGKGALNCYGSNRVAFLVITKLVAVDKKQDYQFLAYQYEDMNNTWAIPSGVMSSGKCFLLGVSRYYKKYNFIKKEKFDFLRNLQLKLFANPIKVYDGYLDDYLNTDDAWIEAIAENYHHKTDDISDNLYAALLDEEMNPENLKFKWINFTDKNIYKPHRTILSSTIMTLNSINLA